MGEWWNDPRLDDEGTYDYMLGYDYNHVPENSEHWRWSWTRHKCTDCGRYAHLYREWEAYFRTYDGYDSFWGSESAYSILTHAIKHGICHMKKSVEEVIAMWKIRRKYRNATL